MDRMLGGFRVAVGSREIADDRWHLRKAKAVLKLLPRGHPPWSSCFPNRSPSPPPQLLRIGGARRAHHRGDHALGAGSQGTAVTRGGVPDALAAIADRAHHE
ncbi:hypothetical protein FXW78_51245 [Rhodococcus opacus]|nr:hypothetical protein [Rhodococcus opacus]